MSTTNQFQSLFEKYQDQQKSNPEDLMNWCNQAFKEFERLGIPDRKNENWKYTNANMLTKDKLAAPSGARDKAPTGADCFEFLDGRLVKAPTNKEFAWSSLSAGNLDFQALKSWFQPMAAISDGFEALTLSMPSDVLFLDVPKNTKIKAPIKINFQFSEGKGEAAQLVQPQVFIRVQEGAELSFEEVQDGKGSGLFNGVYQFSTGANSRVNYCQLLNADDTHRHVGHFSVNQEKDSFFQYTCFTVGGRVMRNSVTLTQNGSGAETVCNGLYLTKNNEHTDFRVNVRHMKPYGVSRQLFKGVLKDRSRAVFNGKIYIEKDAQKVDSSQLNSNLVLSRHAEADSKPELEVYADDVKANHGSAIGQLDEDQLFYLMSRAISREEAVKILARGFVEEVVLKVESEALKQSAYKWLENALVDFQKSLEQSKGFAQ